MLKRRKKGVVPLLRVGTVGIQSYVAIKHSLHFPVFCPTALFFPLRPMSSWALTSDVDGVKLRTRDRYETSKRPIPPSWRTLLAEALVLLYFRTNARLLVLLSWDVCRLNIGIGIGL